MRNGCGAPFTLPEVRNERGVDLKLTHPVRKSNGHLQPQSFCLLISTFAQSQYYTSDQIQIKDTHMSPIQITLPNVCAQQTFKLD